MFGIFHIMLLYKNVEKCESWAWYLALKMKNMRRSNEKHGRKCDNGDFYHQPVNDYSLSYCIDKENVEMDCVN